MDLTLTGTKRPLRTKYHPAVCRVIGWFVHHALCVREASELPLSLRLYIIVSLPSSIHYTPSLECLCPNAPDASPRHLIAGLVDGEPVEGHE